MARTYNQRSVLTSLQKFVLALDLRARTQVSSSLLSPGSVLTGLNVNHLHQQVLTLLKQHRQLLLKLAGLVALSGLVMWNWKLMLALGVGIGAMVLVYALQRLDWQQWLVKLRPWVSGPQKILLLSVGMGSVAMLGTYMAASIWESEHSPWLVSSMLLQGTGMMALLALLTAQILGQESDRLEIDFDSVLEKLAHPDPLKRLLAVRQIHRLLTSGQLDSEQQRTGEQALQLLLHQESEAAVREALLHSLQPKLKPLNLKPRRSTQTSGSAQASN